jgi:CheY-like chemotaxis protein
MGYLQNLFCSGGFMPHGYRYLWQHGLERLYVAPDTLIALAYFSIPLIHFIRKRRDVPFNGVFVCCGIFIHACGATHALEVWNLWHAAYWLSGVVKAVTALASAPTAILLAGLVPEALALPRPGALKAEIPERRRAQETFEFAEPFMDSPGGTRRSCPVLDVQWPRMNGLGLQRRVSGRANAVSIIFITAHSDERLREQALEAGALGFFRKPFNSEALLDAVYTALK